jgi:hypothetical protein
VGDGGRENAEDAEQCGGIHLDESRIVRQFEVRDRSFRKRDFSGFCALHLRAAAYLPVVT